MSLESAEQFGFEFEQEMGYESGESGAYEFEYGGGLGEVQELEMASSLLELNGEYELEQFLGDLISKASSAIGNIAHSPVGHALGGFLKNAAKQALPIAGQMIGNYIGGPAGGKIGSQLATGAGQIFGLEVEGLSHEDRDFEVSRQFVKLGEDAARRAAHEAKRRGGAARLSGPAAHHVAKTAMVEAAKQFAPGLLKPPGAPPAPGSVPQVSQPAPPRMQPAAPHPAAPQPAAPSFQPRPNMSFQSAPGGVPAQPGNGQSGQYRPHPKSGRWIRHGHNIVVLGV